MEQEKKEGGKGEGKRISICHSIQFFSIKKKIEKKELFFNSENLANFAKFLEIFAKFFYITKLREKKRGKKAPVNLCNKFCSLNV